MSLQAFNISAVGEPVTQAWSIHAGKGLHVPWETGLVTVGDEEGPWYIGSYRLRDLTFDPRKEWIHRSPTWM